MSTLNGHCLCGRVRFRAITAEPGVRVCHCGMCRRFPDAGQRLTGAEVMAGCD